MIKQVLLPAIRPDGVMDGGFVVGEPVDFSEEASPYTLASGNVVDIRIHHSPSHKTSFYVAALTTEQARSRAHSAWPEFAPNAILNKDQQRWIGGGSGSAQLRWRHDTSLMEELLKGTSYNVAIPVPTVPPSVLEDVFMDDMPPYGSPGYWSTGALVPPELIPPPGTDAPDINVKSITDFDYVHHQLTASATWIVRHDLGRYPAVVVLDPSGNGLAVSVDHVSKDKLNLIFNTDQTGTCRCV